MFSTLPNNHLDLDYLSMTRDYAFYVTDASGQIKFWNKQATELFGWPEIDIQFFIDDTPWDESTLFLPEDRERSECDWERTQAALNGLVVGERWFVRRDGSRFLGSGILLSVFTDTKQREEDTPWFVRILYDVTPQKCQLERLLSGLKRLEADIARQYQTADTLQ